MSNFHRMLKGWDKLRRRYLKLNPLCRHCKEKGKTTVAREVDHITPLAQGGTDEWENLQALCVDCHKRKTAKEQGFEAPVPFDLSGRPTDADHHWNKK